jgi:predicted DNA-binding protein
MSARISILELQPDVELGVSYVVLVRQTRYMSDMASERITIRIPEGLTDRLRRRSRVNGTTESELIRQALESYLGRSSTQRSAYELAEECGIIGVVRRAPKDLSTNRRRFDGFGKTR